MKFFKFLILIAVLGAAIFSCKKDHRVLGSEVQPENDGVQTMPMEKYPVYAHIVKHDAAVSLNDNFKFLGSNVDGGNGTTSIGLYLNANMTSANLTFGGSPELVSAEIVLAVNKDNLTGVRNALLTYSIFPVDSTLDNKRSYFTSNVNLHDPNNVIGLTYDSIRQEAQPVIRLKINDTYAKAIISDPSKLVSNEAFQLAYKGFYILASSSGADGVIYQCDLDNAKSGLFIKYKPTSADTARTFQFTFSGAKATRFNTMQYSPGPLVQPQLNGDTAQGSQHLYLRGMGVTRLKVQIPFLQNRSDSFSYSVNRAEIVFRIPPSDPRYPYPPLVSLLAIDSLGREILTLDQRTATDVARYEGKMFSTSTECKFNIPLHAQAILNGERKNLGFYIVVADPVPPRTARRDNFAERVILAGHGTATPPVLNISYTRLRRD